MRRRRSRQAWRNRAKRSTWASESGKVESIEVHDLAPRGNEVARELALCVVTRVDLRDCTKLRVGPEHEVSAAGGPLERARPPIAGLEGVRGFRRRLTRGVHSVEGNDADVG